MYKKRQIMNRPLINKLLMLFLALTVAACGEEPGGEVTGKDKLTANLETPTTVSGSRTELLANPVSLVWRTGDSFALIGNDGAKGSFALVSDAGSAEGSFKGTAAGTAPWYALYPDSAGVSLAGGALHFRLPAKQEYATGSIASGVFPAIAKIGSLKDAVQFKNLCSILCLQLTGPSVHVTGLTLHDLGGNMLWGDCAVALDGKEGTAEQTMTLTGGGNTLSMDVPGLVKLSSVTPTAFYFVVPAGALDRGFSLVVSTTNGDTYGIIQTQKPNTVGHSTILMMEAESVPSIPEPSDEKARGYYKDLFMDGGIGLTSRTDLPVAPYLGLEMEYFASRSTGNTKAEDTLIQNNIFIGSEEDLNGALLYPDNKPRFHCIYVNGGKSTQHGASLGEEGLNRLRTYVANGGAYVGTCAGALFSSKGYDSYAVTSTYLGIWPGHTYHTKTDSGNGVSNTYTSMTIEDNCPLLNYYKYGGDQRVDGVRHNGGCYMGNDETYPMPAGTEILMRYLTPGKDSTKLNGQVSAWAYKASPESGRLVVIGSHPEGVTSGEQRDLFAAMIRYAGDGAGVVTPKATLSKGETRRMNQGTEKNNPAYAPIGDRQYHHFNVNLPADAAELNITLTGLNTDCDLYLAVTNGRMAWLSDADYVLCGIGSAKELHIKNAAAGSWSIGVYCPAEIASALIKYTSSAHYYKYAGSVEALNGVSYEITADWN